MAQSMRKMVERVEWMSPIHYEVLAFFTDHDIIINPSSLAVNIDYKDAQYVADTCSELEDAGLLYQHSKGPKYGLTDYGRSFLAGEVDPNDLES